MRILQVHTSLEKSVRQDPDPPDQRWKANTATVTAALAPSRAVARVPAQWRDGLFMTGGLVRSPGCGAGTVPRSCECRIQ